MRWLPCLGVLVIMWNASAFAHDVWVTTVQAPDGMGALIHHGHPGDRKSPDPDKLFELRVIGPDGQDRRQPLTLTPMVLDGVPVLLTSALPDKAQPGTWLLAARYDNGYWVKTEYGYRNTSKREIPGALDSLHSMKYAKALVIQQAPSADAFALVLGHRLELVPVDDPFKVSVGGVLRVRVLYEGKPLAGVDVEIGDGVTPQKEKNIPRYRTNGEGIAEVPIRKPGLQLIVVDHTAPSRHPDLAAKELMAATLSFVVQ